MERIQAYCRIVAEQLLSKEMFPSEIDTECVRTLEKTSALNDIGKVGIPDSILLKPDRLNNDEFEIMKHHTVIGGGAIAATLCKYSSANYLFMARDIALYHHERYDGSGYPNGLSGETIPLSARIVALADVYDALTSRRVYKKAYDHIRARGIICEAKGAHFYPRIVEAFLDREQDFVDSGRRLAEDEEARSA